MLPGRREMGSPHLQSQTAAPTNRPGWDFAAVYTWQNAVPAQNLSLPSPLALSEEPRETLAILKVGYAEAASSQAWAIHHGMCSPKCSEHVKATEKPCHYGCAKAKGSVCKWFTLDNKILFLKCYVLMEKHTGINSEISAKGKKERKEEWKIKKRKKILPH